jgi:catechol 2,3-dioxygenase-like lactoylglutathione lyase family enzyme
VALEGLDHYTINCADLEGTRDFYRDVLGFEVGPRPQLAFAGYWLYCGGAPVVHLLGADGALPENRGCEPGGDTGSFDHIAFRGSDVATTLESLKKHGVAFRENEIRDFGLHQVFVRDPNGITVEMNFRK